MIKLKSEYKIVCRGGINRKRKTPFVKEAYAMSLGVNIAPARMMISFCRDKYG